MPKKQRVNAPTPVCATCACYVARDGHSGRCHHAPPTFSWHYKQTGNWPVVAATDWCRQYEKK
jgi:hypothetical protein